MAALGCAAIVSLVAPVAAHASESAPVESGTAAEFAASASGRFVADPPPAQVNVPMHYQFGFTGDTTAIVASGLPAGLRMDHSGLLTGIPTVANPDGKILLSAFDWGTGEQVDQWVPLPVAEPERPVISGSLPPASADEKYFSQVQATVPPDTSLTFTASGLPEGYAITSTGAIWGGFDAKPGTYAVTITATAEPDLPDRVAVSSSINWPLVVAESERPVFTAISLPAAPHDTPYSYQVSATAPASRPFLKFTASGLPAGFSMSPEGLISGKGNAAMGGKYPVTIEVTASVPGRPSVSASATVTLEVHDYWIDDLGRYNKIVYDGPYLDIPGDRRVSANCPATVDFANPDLPYAPYLDRRTGTAGQSVGQGVIVSDHGAAGSMGFTWVGPARYSGPGVSGIDIRANGAFWDTNPRITVHIVCTSDLNHAWRG